MNIRRTATLHVTKILPLLAGLALGCGAAVTPEAVCPPPVAPVAPAPAAAPESVAPPGAKTFADAVKDAAVVDPAEVSVHLTALIAQNKRLQWKDATPNRKILFVTWTSWNGYDDKIGKEIPLGREVWVTAAPELAEFCHPIVKEAPSAEGKLAPAVVLRLEKLLGLPADGGKDRFVEMWADPSDIFRPCPDPETNDHECSLDFPASKLVTVSADHVTWFENLKKSSYGEKGYPWTRLGYTYDWGNAEGKVGLSEFVIRAGATVEVKGVSKNGEYCR